MKEVVLSSRSCMRLLVLIEDQPPRFARSVDYPTLLLREEICKSGWSSRLFCGTIVPAKTSDGGRYFKAMVGFGDEGDVSVFRNNM